MKPWLGLLIVLGVGIPYLQADLATPTPRADVVRVPTVAEALRFLDRDNVVTPEQLRTWSGVVPHNGPFQTRWLLADGVLLTNNMRAPDGTLQIACWGVEKE
jgi:hypothetical protein